MKYAIEKWMDIKKEVMPLLLRHWGEVALNHAEVPLDVDEDRYDQIDRAGLFLITTVRTDDNTLVGYHAAVVSGHLHYKSTLHAITDVYWLDPDYRRGGVGKQLMQFSEAAAKEKGARKLFTAVKLHNGLDAGPLFEALGYKAVERLYAKII